MNANDQNVTYTFYGLGPDFITWFYPLDTTPIDQEILDPNGQIGLEYYEDIPGAIEHLSPFDSEWFMQKGMKKHWALCEKTWYSYLLSSE